MLTFIQAIREWSPIPIPHPLAIIPSLTNPRIRKLMFSEHSTTLMHIKLALHYSLVSIVIPFRLNHCDRLSSGPQLLASSHFNACDANHALILTYGPTVTALQCRFEALSKAYFVFRPLFSRYISLRAIKQHTNDGSPCLFCLASLCWLSVGPSL